jgi:hypothetical protein
MNLNTRDSKYKPVNRMNNMNHSMMDPALNATLLDKTLYEESFEKLEETIINTQANQTLYDQRDPHDIPLIDKITLGPIEKYQKWNRYPWKMLIHLLLVVMTTLQVLITIQADTNYSRTQSRVIDRIFLTPEGEDDDLSDRRERYIFSIPELQGYVKQSVENYYTINDQSLEQYNYLLTEEGDVRGVNVDILKIDAHSFHFNHKYYYLNSTYLGPFGLPANELKSKLFVSA